MEEKIVKDKDGKEYRFNVVFCSVYYCEDNVVIKDGVATQYPRDRYLLIENLLLDLHTGKIVDLIAEQAKELGGEDYKEDSFIQIFNAPGNKIIDDVPYDFKKGILGEIVIIDKDGSKSVLYIDEHHRIVGYANHHIKVLPDRFFCVRPHLKSVEMSQLESMGNMCFYICEDLETFSAENLETMGDDCLTKVYNLENLHIRNLKTMGHECIRENNRLHVIDLPYLKSMGVLCFRDCAELTTVKMYSLEKMGEACFARAEKLTNVSFNSLQGVGRNCFEKVKKEVREKIADVLYENVNNNLGL